MQLRAWGAAHGGGDVFLPALLEEPALGSLWPATPQPPSSPASSVIAAMPSSASPTSSCSDPPVATATVSIGHHPLRHRDASRISLPAKANRAVSTSGGSVGVPAAGAPGHSCGLRDRGCGSPRRASDRSRRGPPAASAQPAHGRVLLRPTPGPTCSPLGPTSRSAFAGRPVQNESPGQARSCAR